MEEDLEKRLEIYDAQKRFSEKIIDHRYPAGATIATYYMFTLQFDFDQISDKQLKQLKYLDDTVKDIHEHLEERKKESEKVLKQLAETVMSTSPPVPENRKHLYS